MVCKHRLLDPINPRHWIPGYRAIVFHGDGAGAYLIEIDADDDAEALMRAREQAGSLAFELWDALCMLSRHAPHDGKSNA